MGESERAWVISGGRIIETPAMETGLFVLPGCAPFIVVCSEWQGTYRDLIIGGHIAAYMRLKYGFLPQVRRLIETHMTGVETAA